LHYAFSQTKNETQQHVSIDHADHSFAVFGLFKQSLRAEKDNKEKTLWRLSLLDLCQAGTQRG
jgi:hypothetical protein